MGEVNLVKQALFDNGREPVSARSGGVVAVYGGAPGTGIPLAIHADLGNEGFEPQRCEKLL